MFLQKSRAKKQNLAAAIIQASWRGHAVRIRLRREREAQFQALQHKAATVIQVGDFCIYLFFSNFFSNISKKATVCVGIELFSFDVCRPSGECSWL